MSLIEHVLDLRHDWRWMEKKQERLCTASIEARTGMHRDMLLRYTCLSLSLPALRAPGA